MLRAQPRPSWKRTTNTTLNNQIKKSLGLVTQESRDAYYAGKLPARMVIALSRLTIWEQEHLKYLSVPSDPNRAIECALVDDDDNVIVPASDRLVLLQAVTDLFLEDQLSYRMTGKIRSLDQK